MTYPSTSITHQSSMADELLHDFFPLLRAYKNGRIERLTGTDIVPPSLDPATAVHSKDVVIAPEIDLSARLYLPANADRTKKHPLLVYFHGGGFIIESAFSPLYQKHLNHIVAEANVVAVSVNYRLAPEFPLPIAFEDSWRALEWATTEGSDEWINDYADLNRVYIGGDSAGGNIAHNIVMRVGSEKPEWANLRGMFLNCPLFWGVDRIGCETEEEFKIWVEMSDNLVPFVCPTATDSDEPWMNPSKDPKVLSLGCERVLVYTGSKDLLKERGWEYKEVLEKSGWGGEVECVEIAGEGHGFSLFCPDSGNGLVMIKKVAEFINNE